MKKENQISKSIVIEKDLLIELQSYRKLLSQLLNRLENFLLKTIVEIKENDNSLQMDQIIIAKILGLFFLNNSELFAVCLAQLKKQKSIIIKRHIVKILGELKRKNSTIIHALTKELNNYDISYEAAVALLALGERHKDLVSGLMTGLDDKERPMDPEWIIDPVVLVIKACPEAVTIITRILEDKKKDQKIRVVAARIFSEIKIDTGVVTDRLIAVLKESDDSLIRFHVARAIAACGKENPDAITVLTDALTDFALRCEAAEGLIWLGKETPNVISAIKETIKNSFTPSMSHKDSKVWKKALSIFKKLTSIDRASHEKDMFDDAIKYSRTGWNFDSSTIKEILKQFDFQPLSTYQTLLKEKNDFIRSLAVENLVSLAEKDSEARKIIIAQLKGNDAVTKLAFVKALAKSKSINDEIINALVNVLQDKDEDVRISSALTLAELKQPRPDVITILTSALSNKMQKVRLSSANALLVSLKKKSPEAVNMLQGLFEKKITSKAGIILIAADKYSTSLQELLVSAITQGTGQEYESRKIFYELKEVSPELLARFLKVPISKSMIGDRFFHHEVLWALQGILIPEKYTYWFEKQIAGKKISEIDHMVLLQGSTLLGSSYDFFSASSTTVQSESKIFRHISQFLRVVLDLMFEMQLVLIEKIPRFNAVTWEKQRQDIQKLYDALATGIAKGKNNRFQIFDDNPILEVIDTFIAERHQNSKRSSKYNFFIDALQELVNKYKQNELEFHDNKNLLLQFEKIEEFKQNPTVTKLDLSQLKFDKVDFVNFMDLIGEEHCLEELNLSDCNLTDEHIPVLTSLLKKCPTVRVLNLSGNNISDVGAQQFKQALEKNVEWLECNLDGNNINESLQTEIQQLARPYYEIIHWFCSGFHFEKIDVNIRASLQATLMSALYKHPIFLNLLEQMKGIAKKNNTRLIQEFEKNTYGIDILIKNIKVECESEWQSFLSKITPDFKRNQPEFIGYLTNKITIGIRQWYKGYNISQYLTLNFPDKQPTLPPSTTKPTTVAPTAVLVVVPTPTPTPTLKAEPQITPKNTKPTEAPKEPPKSEIPKDKLLLPFPVAELTLLLQICQDYSVDDLIKNATNSPQATNSWKSWITEKFIAKREDAWFEACLSLLDVSVFTKVIGKTLTKTNIFGTLVASVFGREKFSLDSVLGKQLGAILPAKDKFINYLDQFYETTPAGKILNPISLAMALLKDEGLLQFFTDPKLNELNTQLFRLCAAAEVPGLDESAAKNAFTIFAKTQKLIQSAPDKNKIKDITDLQKIFIENFKDTLDLSKDVLALMKQLEKVIQIYLAPQVKSAATLISAVVEKIFTTPAKAAKDYVLDGQPYIDVCMLFEPAINAEKIGCVDHTYFGKLLKNADLSNLHFTSKPLQDSKNLQIYCTFKDLAFVKKPFTFAGTHFTDFIFQNVYLENCDFSTAQFFGEITFFNVIIDDRTAMTFLPVLQKSLESENNKCHWTKGSRIILMGNFPELSIDIALQPLLDVSHVAAKIKWPEKQSASKADSSKKVESTETPTPPAPKTPSPDPATSNPKEEKSSAEDNSYMSSVASYLFSSVKGAVDTLSAAPTMVKDSCASFYQYMVQPDEKTDEALKTDIPDEVAKDFKKIKEIPTELKQEKENNQNRIEELEKLSHTLDAIKEQDKKVLSEIFSEINLLRRKNNELEKAITTFKDNFEPLRVDWLEKQAFKEQQQQILSSSSPQVRTFFGTLLAELTGMFLSLFILQNSSGMITAKDRKVLTESKRGSKASGAVSGLGTANTLAAKLLVNIAEVKPEVIDEAINYLSRFGQQILFVAEKVASATKAIQGVPLIGTGVTVGSMALKELIDWYEKNQLKKMQDTFVAITPKLLEKIAIKSALKIATGAEEQIKLLNSESAKICAKKISRHIMVNVLNRNIPIDKYPFTLAIVVSLRNYSVKQEKWRILGIDLSLKLPGAKAILKAYDDKDLGYTEELLIAGSGIVYQDQSGKEHCFSNDRNLENKKCPIEKAQETFAGKVGYFLIDENEFSPFNGTVVEEERRLPQHAMALAKPSKVGISKSATSAQEIPAPKKSSIAIKRSDNMPKPSSPTIKGTGENTKKQNEYRKAKEMFKDLEKKQLELNEKQARLNKEQIKLNQEIELLKQQFKSADQEEELDANENSSSKPVSGYSQIASRLGGPNKVGNEEVSKKEKTVAPEEKINLTLHASNNTQMPLRTKGGGDCGLHAFGQWNEAQQQFVCDDIAERRKQVAQAIRNCHSGEMLFAKAQDAVQALVMENREVRGKKLQAAEKMYKEHSNIDPILMNSAWDNFEKELIKEEYNGIQDYINHFCSTQKAYLNLTSLKLKFQTCLNEDDDMLRNLIFSIPSLFKAYTEYDQLSKGFKWDEILNDKEILIEYADFIATPGQWILPLELYILAIVFKVSVEFYTQDPLQKIIKPIKSGIYNPGKEKTIAICFNGTNHYERMINDEELLLEQSNVKAEGFNHA